jgi:glycosyltransferase involved in cell wall biosynthesis
MPVYNAEKFLGEVIENILNQTLADFNKFYQG